MKLILQILLILVIAATIGVCIKQPDMHKSVFVYDSAYLPVETNVNEGSKQVETVKKEEVVVFEQPAQKPVQKTTSVTKPAQQTSVKKQSTTTSTPQKKTTTKISQPLQTKQIKKTEEKTAQTVTKTVAPKPKPVEVVTKKEPVQKPVTVQTTTQAVPPVKVLTQQEEEIAWNAWRSALQNKIMQDVKLPTVPNGVVFRFSFTVDKFGKITNLQTWSETSTYTPHAIQYIAPVIRSYQGRSILKFPEGSTRTTTTVKGGWKISSVEKYSTPKDYNDIERVQK